MTETLDQTTAPHVLVVDDDDIIRVAAHESLTGAGFQVSEAENGVRALQALEHIRPDIILLDVMMPEMDGFATAGAVRKLPGFEIVPILIMTALDDLDSINHAYEAGATDFITKPINWVILVQRIRYMVRSVRMMNAQKRLQNELQQAQKLEAVATLAGGVAHDFNNLLQVFMSSAELLRLNSHENSPGSRELDNVIDAAGRGAKLVQQLLTYSRKIQSEKRPIHLNNQVEKVHQLLQRTIPKMIAIELGLENNLNMVEADAVQMEQVLMNLAINAKDAMPDGGRLIIKTANVRPPAKIGETPSKPTQKKWVLLSVTDTGGGIDKDTREHIFEPFFSTKGTGKGTGLGLSMVHGIIKNHNGRISCGSVPGKGTTFHIYLPAAENLIEEKPATKKGVHLVGNETILLVDDDEAIRYSSKKRLEKAGYTVIAASDGETALEIYGRKAKKVHLVLLDLIMPGMGGARCLRELLRIDPEVKVIIISGHYPDDQSGHAIEACACACLRKPYTEECLLNTIHNVLVGDVADLSQAPPGPANRCNHQTF